MLLSVKDSVACWKAVNYYGFFIVFGPIVVLHLGLAGLLKRALMRRDARAVSREEREEEVKRVEWEKREEAKSERRGEGIAALGMDVEELAEEGEEEKEKKVQ
jgi:flagellar biosynthesis/type III secretory pathway M-ring protein FliF/YscJ